MTKLESHTSPDGRLTFEVLEHEGDISLGFEGFTWHTHADLLAASYGCSQTEAVKRFVKRLLDDRMAIAIRRIKEKIADIYITEDPADDLDGLSEHGEPAETLEFRVWSGTPDA
jgi:hypothetical protein